MHQHRLRILSLGSLGALLGTTLLLAGCATAEGEGYIKPGLDVKTVRRIAIVDGNNPSYRAETRQVLVDSFQLEFFRRGWNVIERANVQKAVDEMNFQHSDFASADDRKAIGHVLNVDALAVINIANLGKEISITAKMMDTESGELLWMGSGDGDLHSGLSTVGGALAGAAIGAAAGHNMHGNGAIGAVVGGIAGGAAGNALAPSELVNAKSVVKKVCETLPNWM